MSKHWRADEVECFVAFFELILWTGARLGGICNEMVCFGDMAVADYGQSVRAHRRC